MPNARSRAIVAASDVVSWLMYLIGFLLCLAAIGCWTYQGYLWFKKGMWLSLPARQAVCVVRQYKLARFRSNCDASGRRQCGLPTFYHRNSGHDSVAFHRFILELRNLTLHHLSLNATVRRFVGRERGA